MRHGSAVVVRALHARVGRDRAGGAIPGGESFRRPGPARRRGRNSCPQHLKAPIWGGSGPAPRSMQSVDVSTRRWRRNARSAPRERTTRRNRLGSVAAGGPITLASPRSAEAPCICKLRSRGGHAADPRWAMDRLSPSAYKVVAPDAADRPRLGRQVHGPANTYRETSGAASGATSVPNRPDYNNPST
jgi:hypothetical protein